MGPVLIDVPMDVQQSKIDSSTFSFVGDEEVNNEGISQRNIHTVNSFFANGERPLLLVGAGVGLSGIQSEILNWANSLNLPFPGFSFLKTF